MNNTTFRNTIEFAKELDAEDPLREFRSRFFIPQHNGREVVYLTGNSLGLQPKTVAKNIQQELDDWASLGVEAHFHAKNPWMPYHEVFPKLLSEIVGCNSNEVVVMNQLTVNLHLLMISFYRPTTERYKIICEARAFPSDQYALESQARLHGFDPTETIIEINPREGEHTLRTEDIVAEIEKHGNSVAVVMFGGVNYLTGQFFDIKTISDAAHKVGAFAGFDLAHAAGNVELHLHDWNVDFACWCSYKYLNSGPGGVAGVYIHDNHVRDITIPRLAGWWGYEKETRFKMKKGFLPIPTAEGWQLSNAPVLSMAAHKASLEIFAEAGMSQLHEKRKSLSAYMHFIIRSVNDAKGKQTIKIITPSSENERGCQVSMLIDDNGRKVFEELTANGVVADWREPNVMRASPVPLYNSFEDVWRFGDVIGKIMK